MKKKIADKWVKALRSGKYKRTKEVLCRQQENGKEYCCLGVLCDLYMKEKGGKWYAANGYPFGALKFAGMEQSLPEKVRKWAGMKSDVGHYDSRYDCLSDRNDAGTSFKRIADIIEKNVGKL
jgi:hypothetical protein